MSTSEKQAYGRNWVRIPDGTMVRHRLEGYEGIIDGLTAMIVKGANLNPDRKTQYRIDVGTTCRNLSAEEDLLILLDPDDLVMIKKEKVEWRRYLTGKLRDAFKDEQFAKRGH